MRRRRLGSLAAALSIISLALAATAFAANQSAAQTAPLAGVPAAGAVRPAQSARTLPAGCRRGFSFSEHRRYARQAFHRASIAPKAQRRMSQMRRCQTSGRRGTLRARRTERKLKQWRSAYHCTQSKVVNCIRDATRIHGGDFTHNLSCAQSESGLNPYARNSGGSGATGLYQFMPSTWSSTLARMNQRTPRSIYSAKWQARAAAWKFRHDGFGEWTGAGC